MKQLRLAGLAIGGMALAVVVMVTAAVASGDRSETSRELASETSREASMPDSGGGVKAPADLAALLRSLPAFPGIVVNEGAAASGPDCPENMAVAGSILHGPAGGPGSHGSPPGSAEAALARFLDVRLKNFGIGDVTLLRAGSNGAVFAAKSGEARFWVSAVGPGWVVTRFEAGHSFFCDFFVPIAAESG